MNKKIDTKLAFGILLVVIALSLLLILSCQFIPFPFIGKTPQPPVSPSASELTVEKFSSEEDFKAYLLEAELGYSGLVSMGEQELLRYLGLQRFLLLRQTVKEEGEKSQKEFQKLLFKSLELTSQILLKPMERKFIFPLREVIIG